MSRAVHYAREQNLDVAEFRRVLNESGLGTTRPVGDDARMHAMMAGANLIITARFDRPDGPVVGVARGITDFSWVCYMAEVAVSSTAQGHGIGKGLLDEARRQLGPQVTLILSSMPDVTGFYERIGMARVPDVFWFRRTY